MATGCENDGRPAAVLVAGGAGYIGSHIVRALMDQGRRVVVLDDLSSGHRWATGHAPLVVGDIADQALVHRVVAEFGVGAAIHCASLIQVGESMREPQRYWHGNVAKSISFIGALQAAGCHRIVFSGTAAVYGEPVQLPITEDHPLQPTSVYGRTKLAIEQYLADCAAVTGLRYATLRYFNAAGAHPDGTIGEAHPNESHLIPLVLRAASPGAEPVLIFGGDWPTADGTCIRDYVHVCDLADAHVLALASLDNTAELVCNLGSGTGFSVLEVIAAAERACLVAVPIRVVGRRPGDPAVLVASNAKARQLLGWRPQWTDLDSLVASAWQWETHLQRLTSASPNAGS